MRVVRLEVVVSLGLWVVWVVVAFVALRRWLLDLVCLPSRAARRSPWLVLLLFPGLVGRDVFSWALKIDLLELASCLLALLQVILVDERMLVLRALEVASDSWSISTHNSL